MTLAMPLIIAPLPNGMSRASNGSGKFSQAYCSCSFGSLNVTTVLDKSVILFECSALGFVFRCIKIFTMQNYSCSSDRIRSTLNGFARTGVNGYFKPRLRQAYAIA
jgi:hypothetical protein